jgi:hypothetical protein
MKRAIPTMLMAWAVVVGGGCGEPEGPAVRVALQLVRADAALDTSDVTGFLVRVGVEQQAIPFDPAQTLPVEIEAPPEEDTPIVVFACTLPNGECADRFGDFVGCAVVDLAPSDAPVVVTIALDAREPVPAACADLVAPRAP